MKKIVAICLAIVMTLGIAFCFASCGETNVTIKGITREELDAAVASSTVDVDALKADILANVPATEEVDVDAIIEAVIAALADEEEEVAINGITIVKGDYSVERKYDKALFVIHYVNVVENPEYDAEIEGSEEFIREGVCDVTFAITYAYDVLYYFGAPNGYAPARPTIIDIDVDGSYAVVEGVVYTLVDGKIGEEVDLTICPVDCTEYVDQFEYCTFDFDAITLVD